MTDGCEKGTGWPFCAHRGGLTVCRCSCTCLDQRHCALLGEPSVEEKVIGAALAGIASLSAERDELMLTVERERLSADRYRVLLERALGVMQRVADGLREANG